MMLHTKAAGDIVAATYSPPQYIVEEILPQGLTVLAGAGKIGKSWMGLQLAAAVAKGEEFLGRNTLYGRALFFGFEDDERRLSERMKKQDLVGPDLQELSVVTEYPGTFDELAADLECWIDGSDGVQDSVSDVQARLIVIDTLGRVMPDRSRGRDDYRHAVATLGRLQELTKDHDVAIVLMHHVRKEDTRGAMADPFEQILGSQGIMTTADTTILLERPRLTYEGTLQTTSRATQELQLPVRFDPDRGLWFPMSSPSHAATISDIPRRQREVLSAIVDGHTSTKALSTALEMSPSQVGNVLTELRSRGAVTSAAREDHTVSQVVLDALGGRARGDTNSVPSRQTSEMSEACEFLDHADDGIDDTFCYEHHYDDYHQNDLLQFDEDGRPMRPEDVYNYGDV